MIAVEQEMSGIKIIRLVFDYRKLNEVIKSHPGGSLPTCADRLRNWRQMGEKWARNGREMGEKWARNGH